MLKSSLSQFFYYIAFSLVGTVAAGFIYMLSCDLTFLVVGQPLKFFNAVFFIRGMLVSFPLIQIVSLIALALYNVRHNRHPKSKALTYWMIGLLSWLVLIPFSLNLTGKYDRYIAENENPAQTKPPLSTGIFRQEAGGIFYFSRVNENGTADGLFIDLTGITGEKGQIVRFVNSIIDADFSNQFADTIIRDAIKLPNVILVPLKIYSSFLQKANSALGNGFLTWLLFSSFGFLLLSCSAFENLSVWKLINGISIVFMEFFICFMNFCFWEGFIFAGSSFSWQENLSLSPGIFYNSENPLLITVNLILFVIIFLLGIVLFLIKKENKEV